ncbi:hypothetical protein TNCT_563941 [Trichonephila clavata]|uniref:Uncharacterized protein n=1 Tax=Trichonephila clavata TaxID=2740835 RepID=A0A8X6L6M3_TRICU|nr:hypothetical protein TNCT_563941 [Trichonephila clavata]
MSPLRTLLRGKVVPVPDVFMTSLGVRGLAFDFETLQSWVGGLPTPRTLVVMNFPAKRQHMKIFMRTISNCRLNERS